MSKVESIRNKQQKNVVAVKEIFGKQAKCLYLKGVTSRLFHKYKVENGRVTMICYEETLRTSAKLYTRLLESEKNKEISHLKEKLKEVEGIIANGDGKNNCTNIHAVEELMCAKKEQIKINAAIDALNDAYLDRKVDIELALKYVISMFREGFFCKDMKGVESNVEDTEKKSK